MDNVVKYGPLVPMPPGHDITVETHSSLWPDDCHCHGHHWFCTHTVMDALYKVVATQEDTDGD